MDDSTNPFQLSVPDEATGHDRGSVNDSSKVPVPFLPHDLTEAILYHVPLSFPLSAIANYKQPRIGAIHAQCVSALNVVPLSRFAHKVFLPRLRNGPQVIVANPDKVGAGLLQHLHSAAGFTFLTAPVFASAIQFNRVDVLEWWVQTAALPTPPCDQHFIVALEHAIDNGSWASLDWLAQSRLPDLCNRALSHDVLTDLVWTAKSRAVRFVAQWLECGYLLRPSRHFREDWGALKAACSMGYVQVLEAWAKGHDPWDDDRLADDLCSEAIAGRGPVVPILNCMLSENWGLVNVAEYASKHNNVRVLKWWKANKAEIDQKLQDRYKGEDYDSGPGYGGFYSWRLNWQSRSETDTDEEDETEDQPLKQHDMEVEPDWLSQEKNSFYPGSCLQLARASAHLEVLDWWAKNLVLLPMPHSVKLVIEASGSGDLLFLKAWSIRWASLERSGNYDCTDAFCAATKNGQMAVLEWWMHESDICFYCDDDRVLLAALLSPSWNTMLDWWMSKSGITFDIGGSQVINSCDKTEVLDRWRALRSPLPYSVSRVVRTAAIHQRFHILNWWKNSGIRLDKAFKSHKLVDAVSANGSVAGLEWIRSFAAEREYEFLYSSRALDRLDWRGAPFSDGLSGNCRQLQIVKWWCSSGLKLEYSSSAFHNAFLCLSNTEKEWWLKQSLPARYSNMGLRAAVLRHGAQVATWLKAHGLDDNYESDEEWPPYSRYGCSDEDW